MGFTAANSYECAWQVTWCCRCGFWAGAGAKVSTEPALYGKFVGLGACAFVVYLVVFGVRFEML